MNGNRAKNGLFAHKYNGYLFEPDRYPPNSNYWKMRAKGAAKMLRARVGEEAYQKLIDCQVKDAETWKETAQKLLDLVVVSYDAAKLQKVLDECEGKNEQAD